MPYLRPMNEPAKYFLRRTIIYENRCLLYKTNKFGYIQNVKFIFKFYIISTV